MNSNCHNLCCPNRLPFQNKNVPWYGYCSERCWKESPAANKEKKTCHFCSTEIERGVRIKKQNYCNAFCREAEKIIEDVNGVNR